MTISDTELEVYRLNGRDYIQATQMIARLGELLRNEESILVEAKFVRLTNRKVYAELNTTELNDATAIGSASFLIGTHRLTYQFFELSDAAPCKTETASMLIHNLQHDSRLNGCYSFVNAVDIGGVLDALVQGVKLLHLGLPQQVSDIWFTSLRNYAFPLSEKFSYSSGNIRVSRIRVISNEGRHQSLMKVTLGSNG